MEDMFTCKWFWLAVSVTALSVAWYSVSEGRNQVTMAAACAPAGLVQQVDGSHVIWVKPTQQEAK